MKYICVKTNTIIQQVAKKTDVEGYTIGVIECFLPSDEEAEKMTQKQQDEWIKENNKRMKAICKFLNRWEKQVVEPPKEQTNEGK